MTIDVLFYLLNFSPVNNLVLGGVLVAHLDVFFSCCHTEFSRLICL